MDEAYFLWNHIKYNDLAFEEKEVAVNVIEQIAKEVLPQFYLF
jgi:hypothetical protein